MKHKLLNKLLALTLFILGGAFYSPAWGATTTASVSISTYASTNKWANSTAHSSVTIDTNVSASGKSNGNNSKYYSSNESWRHYEGDSGEITISVTGSYALKSVTFTYANGNSGVIIYDDDNYTTGSACTAVEGLTSATFYVGHSSGTKNGNVQITNISVTYAPTHTLIYSASNGSIGGVVYGTSTAVASGSSIIEGGKVTLTATPTDSYSFTSWSVDVGTLSSSTDNPTTFTMGTANATVTANFAAGSVVANPIFTVPEGTYNETQSVELNCATDDATIYYTTDGTDPSSTSIEYTGTIAVNVTTTIKAIAIKDGMTDSEVASATYTLKCATPTITIPSGVFVSTKNVTIGCTTTGAVISYSTDDGTNWTAYSTPFSISTTTTVLAKATKSGWSDSDEASETFTKETVLDGLSALVAKTNTSDQSYYVELSDAQVTYVNGKHGYMEDDDAGIYIYNISPTLNKVYNGIFRITYQLYNSMPELKAITAIEGEITDGNTKAPIEMTASALSAAFDENLGRQIQITGHTTSTTTVLLTGISFYTTYYNPSFQKDHTYTIVGYPYNNNGTLQFRVVSAVEKPDAPTISPNAGEFSTDFTLTLSAVTGATMRYTTDGSTPTASLGSVYDPENKPTISAGADVTVKAVAILAGMTSDVASTTYTYSAISRPSFAPVDGTSLYYGETVELACDVDGSTIYYTTDGSTPTSSSFIYNGPIAIEANSITIKAKANKGENWSSEASATFTLKTPDAPTAVPGAGAVEAGTSIVLNSREGTTIYYTIDGSTPDNESTPYSNAITIDAAKTIKAIAYDGAGNNSTVLTVAYSILKVATPTFGTATSSFPISQEVSINCEIEGATIYYTTDGTNPTTSSTEYSGAFTVTSTTTVKAIAVKANCTNSDVASVTYTKATVYTVADVNTGNYSGNNYVIGYIVGFFNAYDKDATTTATSSTVSNVALSDSPNEIGGANTIAIQLPSGALRNAWNIYDNAVIGYKVLVYGSIESYFSNKTGVKSTSEITAVAVPAVVSTSSYATFAAKAALDFTDSNIKAYIAEAKDDGSGVTFERVYKIPANTGVLLYKDGGATEEIPVTTESTDDVENNIFVRGTGATVASVDAENDNLHNYILNKVGGVIGFYRANDKVVAKNRAYIQIDESVFDSSLAKDFISMPGFDDDPTGINEVNGSELTVNGPVYDLQGRRIEKPGMGLYIVNGKKIFKY